MTQITSSCPLCGSSRSQFFERVTFRGQAIDNRICAACGLVYQSPRMDDKELAAFYEREYRQLYQGGEGPNAKDLAVQRGRAEALLAFAQPHISAVTRHLDIGCSAGLLLQRFQKEYACQPVGVEPGLAYRAYAQQQGLAVYASLDELRQAGEAAFDLISMAHVLEHLPDPVAYLASLRQTWLAPGGRLLLEVPNLYAHDSFEVAHLVAYSPHSLGQTLLQAGFEVASVRTHGEPRSRLLPLYVTMLARPSDNPAPTRPAHEGGVKLKRRAGMLRRRILTRLFPAQAWLPLKAGPYPVKPEA